MERRIREQSFSLGFELSQSFVAAGPRTPPFAANRITLMSAAPDESSPFGPLQPAEKEYIIFLDESERKGTYYSNFYGGVMVGGGHYNRITKRLNDKKQELNFFGEVKWSKVSEPYLAKYIALVETFLAEVTAGHLRVRVMFRQNANKPQNLTREQIESEYFMLYYQFVKHAFGLLDMPEHGHPVALRLYFDDLPDKAEKRQQFKGYVLALGANTEIAAREIVLTADNITEVRSHDHVLLQCLDIVLGAMVFRLNDKHLEKPVGSRVRGRKTRAKEQLYKVIYAHIAAMRPHFNIGISTGLADYAHGHWTEPYRHWKFVPAGAKWDGALTKPRK